MTNATTRIKNLSIALRALSKGHYKNFGDRIFALLAYEIAQAEEERSYRPTPPPPARPAIPNDDIPF